MLYVWALLLASFMLMIIICLTKLKVHIHYKHQGADDLLEARLSAWFGLFQLKSEMSVQMAGDWSGMLLATELDNTQERLDQSQFKLDWNESSQLHQRIVSFVRNVRDVYKIMRQFLKKVEVEQLSWVTVFGTGHASTTGQLTGWGWALKSILLGAASTYVNMRTFPHYNIVPSFQEEKLATQLSCMFRLRIGHAILAGIRVLLNLRKKA